MEKLKDKELYQMQADLCCALSHPVRLQILDLLANSEKCSTQLLEILELPKANLSQHLHVLKNAGIIKSRKEGSFYYFSVALPKIKEACSIVSCVLEEKIVQDELKFGNLKKNLKIINE